MLFLFCKKKTSYVMRISDWSSDVSSSDLAETLTGRLIEAEIGECLPQIEIGLAGADDAERATFAIDDDAVDAVGARECGRRRQAQIDELVFFDQRRLVLLQIEAVGRQRVIARQLVYAMRIGKPDRRGQIQRIGDALEARKSTRLNSSH